MAVTRIFDLLDRYKNNLIKDAALAGKSNGKWVKYSTEDYINYSCNFSYGLLELGLKKGDKIATISSNCPEWNFVDMGMSQIGVVHVPIYPTISAEEHKYILNHCEAKLIILSDKIIYSKLKTIIEETPNLKKVYSFNDIENVSSWREIIELGKKNKNKYSDTLEKIKSEINENDILTLIYTSGTTGTPKGVMLSHKNILSNSIAVTKHQLVTSDEIVLSFLPLCHVYERMMNYHYQYKGIGIYYSENLGAIADDILEIKPFGFNTVPRLLEKIYAKVIAKGKSLPFLKKILFFWAVNLTTQFDFNNKNLWHKIQLIIADKLIYKQFRKALGGNIKLIVCGGSSLQVKLAKFFWASKIPILEGYGLTEASPVISVNHLTGPGNIKIGTVGPILEGVEVKIAHDGEILCKGPNIMQGYYKDPDYTKEIIDSEGWLHTGDIGIIEDNKFLKITDRKKEIFKTSGGKYIAPQLIENLFKESYFIDQVMVVGENEKFASALISPNFNNLQYWANKHKIDFKNNAELLVFPKVIARFQKEVDKYNKILGSTEQIKRFKLVNDEWTPQSGELSQTLKLKRKVIYKKYDSLLKEIYFYQN